MSSWHATFTTGWKTPTQNLVDQIEGNKYVLKTKLFPKTDIAPIDHVSHMFILPEGASVTNIDIPIEAEIERKVQPLNMDFKGRTMINISIRNAISTTDNIEVKIEYSLPTISVWYSMFYLWLFFGIIFISFVLFRHINCSININKKTTIV